MRVGGAFIPDLHTDSIVKIEQAGALGDSFIDISSVQRHRPGALATTPNSKIKESSSIEAVLGSSEDT